MSIRLDVSATPARDAKKGTDLSKHDEQSYGAEVTVCPIKLTAAQERRIWRRIDLRLMPIITIIYLLSFMDRGNIGNAKLDGLMTQLKLTGDKYNIALTAFMIPYSILEFPCNLVIQIWRPSRWIPTIMVLWGLSMTLMGFVKTYPQLVGARVCLGVAEAGFYPGVAYYLTMWYPRYMYLYRVALFSGAATMAGAFSGLLAYGINFMNGDGGLEGWSWIFILEGLATVVVALIAAVVMVNYPSTVKFLTEEERSFVAQKRVEYGSQDEEDHVYEQVWAAFTDWQVWALSIIELSVIVPVYGITFFLPTIIHNFGYNTSISQLLTVPPYMLATVVLLTFAHFSDKLQKRSPFVFASQLIALTGYVINISNAPSSVKYFGTFLCVIGSYSAFPGSISWLANNLGGRYKRAVGMAIQIGVGNMGGAIASNIYRTRDEPRYLLGHGLEIMFLSIGIVTLPFTVLAYQRINAKRDLAKSSEHDSEEQEKKGGDTAFLGDRRASFRYTI
ncbi:MFS general substrate transporter [Boletus edulis]|nr:MFS general substrate transporter [Boletus edulis]